jgi:hypothetical protein
MVFHTLPTARSFTLHHFFMHPDRSSMHFHALPPLFHRSSIALPSFFHHRSSRMGLRLILRGGGCNRAPPLLFSRSPLAHQHQHPTASLDSILQSSSFVRLVIVVPPSRSVSRLVSSRLVRLPRLLLRLCRRPFVRSFVRRRRLGPQHQSFINAVCCAVQGQQACQRCAPHCMHACECAHATHLLSFINAVCCAVQATTS